MRDWYCQQGDAVEQALHCSLPGGTYDQLLRAMLMRKATLLAVTHQTPDIELEVT